MKLLAILPSSPAFSYGQLLEGFTITLGKENVWIWYGEEDISDFFFIPSWDEILDNASMFDVIFYAYHPECHHWVKQVRDITSDTLLVLVDNSDSYYLSSAGDFKPDIIIKQEMLIHYNYPDNCYPCPLSVTQGLIEKINLFAIDKDPNTINITWVLTSKFRQNFYGKILNWAALNNKKAFGILEAAGLPRIDHSKHLQNLCKSEIAIAPSSAAMGCGMLFWESVLAGCCCFTDNYRVRLIHSFRHLEHVIYFYKENSIIETLNEFTHNYEFYRQIGIKGREYVLKYHTSIRRAEYVLEILAGKATISQL